MMPYLLTGQYDIAARLGRHARDAHPGLSSTFKVLLSALGHLRAAQGGFGGPEGSAEA